MTFLKSFDPVIKQHCRVLILGSMPGVASLQQQQYYAHPRNAFWAIMNELYDIRKDSDYEERCSSLTAIGLGIWDVLRRCKRSGSLDSSIDAASAQANNFLQLLSSHQSLEAIYFNGGAAERLFKRHVLSLEQIQQYNIVYRKLPSTSPAYAAMSLDKKIELWRMALAPR